MDADEKLVGVGSGAHEEVKSMSAPKPPSIEDFVVLKPISRGAFGKVYLARKKCNSRLYAVKVMKKADMVDKNMTGQMKAERDALALSKSPFVVHLFYSLQTATKIYLIMEYLIGGDVKSLLHIYGYFDQDMSVKYISEVALALDYLHRHGIIHRDLKPDNMLITNEGHIKLTDFGLSKVKLDRELSLADILTTPSLAKPKQDYFRTPGQVLSLISSLGFNTPGAENKRHCSTSAAVTPMSCTRPDERKHSLCLPPRKKDCIFSPGFSTQACGRSSAVFSPCAAVPRSLTPCRLRSRIRCETMSAASSYFPSTTESEGVSPLWEHEEKENGLIHEKRLTGQPTKGVLAAPETSRPTCDSALRALVTIDNLPKGTRGRFDSTPVAKPKRANSDTLSGKRPQSKKAEPATRTQSELLSPVTGSSRNVSASSLKRTFADVDISPEALERQAKRSDADYDRCYKVPEESAGRPTGLTMVLSGIHLDDLRPSTERRRAAEKEEPTPSSPSAVAKNLLCELEEPLDDVFLAGVRAPVNSSFAFGEDQELQRNLSFDSEGSVHETSVTSTSPTSPNPGWCSKDRVSPSAGETSNWATSGPLPCTPTPANIESRKSRGFSQKDVSKGSFFDGPPELACSIPKSPPFLKPRNVVAFRSYCSAIERSNASWNSRLSLGSVEAMDMSVSASYHGVGCALTPMQKRPSSSLCQTPQPMMTSQTPFRTPKSVRRGTVPIAGGPILGTPDYLAPELLLEKSHDFMVDWWALGVCLFEFLTGVPPFNDETPHLVFQNILNRDIPWPADEEELSANSRNAIEILLTMDKTKRAGFKELRCHPLFEGLDWDNLQSQKMPFVPQPEDETDTSYFDARNNAQQLAVSGFSL